MKTERMLKLACPSCGGGEIDFQKRECRSCKIGLPIGSNLIAYDVGPLRSRAGGRGNRAITPVAHSRAQGRGFRTDLPKEDEEGR